MKKKKILLISVLGLSALTAFGVFAGATSTKGFAKLIGAGEKVTWNHYSAELLHLRKKALKNTGLAVLATNINLPHLRVMMSKSLKKAHQMNLSSVL